MNMVRAFAHDDDGAQIIEYALIVAVVSLGLILLMMGTGGLDFTGWIGRVNDCLQGATTCA
ncbi:Flp family type IVb pilin [Ramlibacter tataouinensis]|uniref:Flp family type IVb pilin n=1 Tax=Ramlibacter tataouinensis TaxID=94132 RepID=UPI0022F39031|nr:Flp family type IVb pilin [Ramlibacter tataouinensis]WBY02601.1 Flp family type IVb pilin [Ramlibacter tataouinensis]